MLSRLFIFLKAPLHGYKVLQVALTVPDLSKRNYKKSCVHTTLKAPLLQDGLSNDFPRDTHGVVFSAVVWTEKIVVGGKAFFQLFEHWGAISCLF